MAHTERIGNRQSGMPRGAIEVRVVLDASGLVRVVSWQRGPEELREAARRIIMLAQPYPAFPEALRAQREQLAIQRRWLFGDAGVALDGSRP